MVDGLAGLRWFWRRGLAVVVLLLVLLTTSSCSQIPGQSEASQRFQYGSVLEFVPRQVVLAAVIDTAAKPGDVWQLSYVKDAAASFLTPLSIDLSEDILPWLGRQVVFSVTDKDLDRDFQNGHQTGYLLVAEASDGERLREFLELFWQHQVVAGAQPRFVKANGVPMITGGITQGNRSLATAVVGETTLLVANDESVLRQSLRVAQAPGLQLPKLDTAGPVQIHLQIPEFLKWLGIATPAQQVFMAPLPWQTLTATTEIQPQGLVATAHLSTAVERDSAIGDVSETSARISRDELYQYLPRSTVWAAIGQDLYPLWLGLQNELKRYQNLPEFIQQWQVWEQSEIAQTLTEPLTQLLAGPYAIGQLGDGTGVMVVDSAHATAISQLDRVAVQQGLTVSHLTLKGQLVTVWSQLKTRLDTRNRETTVETDVIALHTQVGDCALFATSLSGLTAALDAPTDNLLATPRFRRTVQPMETENQEYLYGTWDEIERLLASNRWFSLVQPIVQPWTKSIDAIALTSYEHSADQLTGMVSVSLKK